MDETSFLSRVQVETPPLEKEQISAASLEERLCRGRLPGLVFRILGFILVQRKDIIPP